MSAHNTHTEGVLINVMRTEERCLSSMTQRHNFDASSSFGPVSKHCLNVGWDAAHPCRCCAQSGDALTGGNKQHSKHSPKPAHASAIPPHDSQSEGNSQGARLQHSASAIRAEGCILWGSLWKELPQLVHGQELVLLARL